MKLKSILTAILGTLMLSEGAFALSCARPDLIQTLEEAKASDKMYHILAGKFISEPSVNPQRRGWQLGPQRSDGTRGVMLPQANKTPKVTQSWFEGITVGTDPSRDGQLTRYPVEIETRCAGQWCSSPPSSNREVVAFVETREGLPPILRLTPCAKWMFSRNVPAQVSTIRQCLDKDCTGEPLRSPDAYTHPRPQVNPRLKSLIK